MKKTVMPILAILALLVGAGPLQAQGALYPVPVDLGIANEEQQIEEWYWPALIRQILAHRALPAPTQCQMASEANIGVFPPVDCCQEPIPEACKRSLEPEEVVATLGQSGLRAELTPRPKTAEEVYEHLQAGRAILVGFRISKDKKHAYLVRGVSWAEDGRAMLLINDPHVTEPFQAPFAEEVPGWQTVIVIQP